MSGYIASDAQNPEFVGAHNPDSRLSVTFYKKAVRNDFESALTGEDKFIDVDYVKIFIPGDDKTVIDTPANVSHKQRFPLQWSHYQNTNGQAGEMGTPLADWPMLTDAQKEELRHLKFFTVESIANAGDAQIQAIGMLAGMSAYKFRDKARDFIRKPNVTEKALEDLKAEHSAQINELKEMIASLVQSQNQEKRVGRPPKE